MDHWSMGRSIQLLETKEKRKKKKKKKFGSTQGHVYAYFLDFCYLSQAVYDTKKKKKKKDKWVR